MPDDLEPGDTIAERHGMSTSTTNGISRLDRNQTPAFEYADVAAADVLDPPESELEPRTPEPTNAATDGDTPTPPAERPPGCTEKCTAVESSLPTDHHPGDRDDHPSTTRRLLVITALTTLFWAPMAWLLHWIG